MGRGWGRKEVSFLPLPLPLFHFGALFISRAAKAENPVPRSFFAPKPNGNACDAGLSKNDDLISTYTRFENGFGFKRLALKTGVEIDIF